MFSDHFDFGLVWLGTAVHESIDELSLGSLSPLAEFIYFTLRVI
jgi:hypothetical protein